jgi:hypothetical protein
MTKYGPALAAQESPWNSAASWDHPTPERQNFSVERITNCRMSVTIRAAGQGRGYERVGGRALRTGLLVVTDLMRAQRGSRLWSVRRRTLGLCRGDRHKVARRQDRLSRQAMFVNAQTDACDRQTFGDIADEFGVGRRTVAKWHSIDRPACMHRSTFSLEPFMTLKRHIGIIAIQSARQSPF